jgi:hypothetical protein
MLRRAGWKSSDVHDGDEVTAVIAPLLNGEHGGLLLELKVPDGRTLVPPVPAIRSLNSRSTRSSFSGCTPRG